MGEEYEYDKIRVDFESDHIFTVFNILHKIKNYRFIVKNRDEHGVEILSCKYSSKRPYYVKDGPCIFVNYHENEEYSSYPFLCFIL